MSSWMQCNGNMMEWLTMRRGIIFTIIALTSGSHRCPGGTASNAKATILSSGGSLQSLELAYIDQLVEGIIDVCPDYPGSNSSSSQILVPSLFLLILIYYYKMSPNCSSFFYKSKLCELNVNEGMATGVVTHCFLRVC